MARRKNQDAEASGGGARQDAAEAALCFIPVTALVPSMLNPRKTVSGESLQNLAASVARYGILSPLTVRPVSATWLAENPLLIEDPGNPPTHEIICGYRRWYAAKKAGLETVPAIVREMTDDEALDLMITENLQREDISPLEEAEAYALLFSRCGSVAEMAARFGKSEKYIRGRLHLNDLTEIPRAALEGGLLTLTAAIEVSKMTPEQQDRFAEVNRLDDEEAASELSVVPVSVGDVKEFLDDESLNLDNVPFLDDDEPWNATMRKCCNCQFNTSSQGALFPELAERGQCTDAECYYEKVRRYAHHVLEFWKPNLLPESRDVEGGTVVLGVPGYSPYFSNSKTEYLYNELRKLYKAYKQSPNYDSPYNRLGDEPLPDDVYKKIDLYRLVRGERYISYHHTPAPRQTLKEAPDRWDHARALDSLRAKRAKDLKDEQLPLLDAALESCLSEIHVDVPGWMEAVMAVALAYKMSYNSMYDIFGARNITLPVVTAWLKDHTLISLASLTLNDIVRNNPSESFASQMLDFVLTALVPEAAGEARDKVYAKYQARYDKLVGQLAELGYDEYNRPLDGDADDEPDPDGREEPDDSDEPGGEDAD